MSFTLFKREREGVSVILPFGATTVGVSFPARRTGHAAQWWEDEHRRKRHLAESLRRQRWRRRKRLAILVPLTAQGLMRDPTALKIAKKHVFDHLAAGDFRPKIDRVFPLKEIEKAYQHLNGDSQAGKIVVVPQLSLKHNGGEDG